MKNRSKKLREAIDLMHQLNNSEFDEVEVFLLVNNLNRINRTIKWQYSDTYDKIQGLTVQLRREMELFSNSED